MNRERESKKLNVSEAFAENFARWEWSDAPFKKQKLGNWTSLS